MIADATYTVLFYGLSIAVVVLALAAVNARQLLRAALGLMGMLALSAGFYVMLRAEFLAGVQILVYVGGIVVLIVFAIMLTRSSELLEDHPRAATRAFGAVFSIAFMLISCMALRATEFPVVPNAAPSGDEIHKIGVALLDRGSAGYLLPFEVVSLLLLVAVVGGTVVARKTPPKDQPFTTGGDLRGETILHPARVQDESPPAGGKP
ncbi:MAG: NADH-quinone oxidoreductase subunit J [Candidatus Hydrogenedentes bacterium]|nr:NADH-quinone oxidoreductase subunit J [Candidatus Hydrogenedentota bacterium]